jgi:hypothetical protein
LASSILLVIGPSVPLAKCGGQLGAGGDQLDGLPLGGEGHLVGVDLSASPGSQVGAGLGEC